MSTPSRVTLDPKVVRLKPCNRRMQRNTQMRKGTTAELLSIRQHLRFQASVEVDQLATLQTQFASAQCDLIARQARTLLDNEFGRLRVFRNRRYYIVQHHCIESLVAGLLRCQFHARQILLPERNVFDEMTEQDGVSLTWGVGQSVLEAEGERLKRRRQKTHR